MKRSNDKWIGKKFNKWTVVDCYSTEKGLGWMCECECGRIKKQKVWNVKSGKSRMCIWCSRKERKEKNESNDKSTNEWKE